MPAKICKLCQCSTSAPVAGFGPKDAKLIVIGDYPNGDDESSGIPFSKSKKPEREKATGLIRLAIKSMGLDPANDVYWVHALRCNPYHHQKPVDVNEKHVTICRTLLEKDLMGVTAPVVLLLGKWATASVLGNTKGVAYNRVFPHYIQLAGMQRTAIVSFSASEIDRRTLWNLDEDFRRLSRFSPRGSAFSFFNQDLKIVRKELTTRGLIHA